MKRLSLLLMGCMALVGTLAAQDSLVVYPTNWWVGMKYPTLQVMIRGKDIGKTAAVNISYPGVQLLDWHRAESPNYLFLHLRISPAAAPGTIPITIGNTHLRYPLLA